MWATEIDELGGLGMLLAKRRLLEIFKETSFKASKDEEFRLASGKFSRHYIDCKQALSDPEARLLIGKMIFHLIAGERFDSVGGLELGAYPIATSVSDAIYREVRQTVRAFVIRKVPKSHGVRDLIAGHTERNDNALIVDDVVTSGQSTIQAIRCAREAGLRVTRVIVLVDRQEDSGRKHIEDTGVKFESLLTLRELREPNDDATTEDDRSYQERLTPGQPHGTLISR